MKERGVGQCSSRYSGSTFTGGRGALALADVDTLFVDVMTLCSRRSVYDADSRTSH